MKLIPKPEHSVLHLFYLFILFYLITAGIFGRITDPALQIPVDPHFLIRFIPHEFYALTIKLFSILGLLSLSCLVINPWVRSLRILAFISWLIYFAYSSSFGKSINDQYASTFALLTFIFLPSSKDNQSKIDEIITLAKFQAVMCYAMAGLWKIRVLPLLWDIDGIMPNLGNAIAMEHMKYGNAEKISDISLFFMNNDTITGTMFLGLVLLQTFSPLMVFNRKAQIFLGIMIVIFHVLSEVMLNINFRSNMYIMMILFLYDPLLRMYLDRKQSKLVA